MFGFRRSLALSAKGVVNAFEKVGPANRIISSTHREPQRRGLYLTNVLLKKPDGQTSSARLQQDTQKVDVQKGAKKSAGKTSLRRVAVEVERLRRGFIKEKGNKRFVDPDLETKTVTAFCAAQQYDIPRAAVLLEEHGQKRDPHETGLYPQVIHTQVAWGEESERSSGDMFVFASGAVVTWNIPEDRTLHFVNHVLQPAASVHTSLETEDLQFIEDPMRDYSEIIGDTIIFGTSAPERSPSADTDAILPTSPEADMTLAKIAFSSGLARSAKLAVLEQLFNSYFNSTRELTTRLSRGTLSSTRFPLGRRKILQKTGELLNIRAQLNLYSELTDSLPDLFWDSRHELGLESYYDNVGRALDVGIRIKVLNEKMDYAQEIAVVMREQLSEEHSLRLEWIIIWLIAVEVMFELRRIYLERRDHADPGSTENLLRRYLEAELGETGA